MTCYFPLPQHESECHAGKNCVNRGRHPSNLPHRLAHPNPLGAWPRKPNFTNPSAPPLGPVPRGKRPPPLMTTRTGNPSLISPIAAATALPRSGPSTPTTCCDTSHPHTLIPTPPTTTTPTTHLGNRSPPVSGRVAPSINLPHFPPFEGGPPRTRSVPSATLHHPIPSRRVPPSSGSTRTPMLR